MIHYVLLHAALVLMRWTRGRPQRGEGGHCAEWWFAVSRGRAETEH